MPTKDGLCQKPEECPPCWSQHLREKLVDSYGAIQWSWFTWVNAFCDLLCKELRMVAAAWFTWVNAFCDLLCKELRMVAAATSGLISEQVFVRAVYNNGSWTYNCEAVKMPLLLPLQELQGKDDRGWRKKSVFASRPSWPEDWKKEGGFAFRTSNKFLLVARHTLTKASQNAFKAGAVNFVNPLSPPFTVKKVCTRTKNSQGT